VNKITEVITGNKKEYNLVISSVPLHATVSVLAGEDKISEEVGVSLLHFHKP
jgi:hypothetical protein